MSYEELVKEYRARLSRATNKKVELERIIQEIDQLVYSESNLPISNADKIRILEGLRGQISIVLEHRSIYAQDNTEILKLITKTVETLKGK